MNPLPRRPGPIVLAVPLFLLLVLASGCSGSFDFSLGGGDETFHEAGVNLIQGELADQIGLGPLVGACAGDDLAAGDTFGCTGTTGDGEEIRFLARINQDEDGVDLTSENLLLAAQVEEIETFAASLIEEQTSAGIGSDNFECANRSLVVEVGGTLDCLVTDPADGTVYEAPVTIDDLQSLQITVNVGDPIG